MALAMELDRNQHSVYLLHYHLVMVVKYRRKVINNAISNRLMNIFSHIGNNYGISLEEWNHEIDHVHVMFRSIPSTNISKFINAYKSASSRIIKREYLQIKDKLWKEAFWSKSYCLISTGGVTIDVIRKYIESQGDNNETKHSTKNKNISK